MKRLVVLLIFILSSNFSFSQEKMAITESDYANQKIEMADQFRAEGKIYVLTGIICLILGGLVVYLVIIDKKVGKLEKLLPKDNS